MANETRASELRLTTSASAPSSARAQTRTLATVALAIPPLALLAVGAVLAIQGGGIVVEQWAPVAVGLALAVLVLAAVGSVTSIPRDAWPPLIAFGGFVAWSALSLSWTAAPEATVTAVARAAMLGLAMIVGAAYASRPGAATLLAGGLVTAGIALAVCVEAKVLISTSNVFTESRLSWPIDYPNGAAALLCLAVPTLAAFAAAPRLGLLGRPVVGGAAALAAAEGLMALSRGAVVGLVGALIVSIWLTPNRAQFALTLLAILAPVALLAGRLTGGEPSVIGADATNRAHAAAGAALAAALLVGALSAGDRFSRTWVQRLARPVAVGLWVCVVVGAIATFGMRYGRPDGWAADRWHEFRNLHATKPTDATRFGNAASNRYDYWRVAVRSFADHPIDGVGAGAFSVPWFRRRAISESVTDAHSWEANALVETGAVGFALLAVALLAPLVRLARMRGRNLATTTAAALGGSGSYLILNASVDWLLRISAIAIPGFLILGACAATGEARDADLVRPRQRSILAAAGAAAALAAAPVYASATLTARAEEQAAISPSGALDTLSLAAHVNPWAVEPLIIRSVLKLDEGRPQGAVQAARAATRRAPNDWTAWLALADAERAAARQPAAVAAARRAQELNPRAPITGVSRR